MGFSAYNVDNLITQAKLASAKEFSELAKQTLYQLKKEKKNATNGKTLLLAQSGRTIVVGDLHGDIQSLAYTLKDTDFPKKAGGDENIRLIFLGDYGDRGLASPEVYFVVQKLKAMFPDKVVLMRGNHEGPFDMLPYPHDLPMQLRLKFGEEAGMKIYSEVRELWEFFYDAVIIKDFAVLIHGGFPSAASSLEDLAYAYKKHPKETFLEEMLWSDPQDDLVGTLPSRRGIGKFFGADVTERLLRLLNVKFLIRGHEACQEGYKINHNGKVLTLFSTNKPPYNNKCAAYLQIDLLKKISSPQQLKKYIRQFE